MQTYGPQGNKPDAPLSLRITLIQWMRHVAADYLSIWAKCGGGGAWTGHGGWDLHEMALIVRFKVRMDRYPTRGHLVICSYLALEYLHHSNCGTDIRTGVSELHPLDSVQHPLDNGESSRRKRMRGFMQVQYETVFPFLQQVCRFYARMTWIEKLKSQYVNLVEWLASCKTHSATCIEVNCRSATQQKPVS